MTIISRHLSATSLLMASLTRHGLEWYPQHHALKKSPQRCYDLKSTNLTPDHSRYFRLNLIHNEATRDFTHFYSLQTNSCDLKTRSNLFYLHSNLKSLKFTINGCQSPGGVRSLLGNFGLSAWFRKVVAEFAPKLVPREVVENLIELVVLVVSFLASGPDFRSCLHHIIQSILLPYR